MADEEMLQDFLLDMDFDELIPVDNFFDSYVGQLTKETSNPGVLLRPAGCGVPPVVEVVPRTSALAQEKLLGCKLTGTRFPVQAD